MTWTMALDSLWSLLYNARPAWWDSRLTIAGFAILPLLLLLLMYHLMSLNADRAQSGGKTPPQVPYFFPFVGNTIVFAFDGRTFLKGCLRRYGKMTPFRLWVGMETYYYIPQGEMVQAMVKKSRELTSKPLVLKVFRDQFLMPAKDLAVYERDHSGIHSRPHKGTEDMDPAQRIFFHQHRIQIDSLNGSSLSTLVSRFTANYTAKLQTTSTLSNDGTWVELPDLFEFFKSEMFHATTTAVCGEHIFKVCPDFSSVFWDFDRNIMTYLRTVPRLFAPKAHAIRDQAIALVKKWQLWAATRFDVYAEDFTEPDYEPIWGSRYIRSRARLDKDLGISADGSAGAELGLIWGANANVIPGMIWALLQIHLSDNLTERVRAETMACWDVNKGKGWFDVHALASKPLLSSIFLEALRYSVAGTSARNPLTDDFEIDGWKMERNSVVMSISWLGHRDETFWNEGRILASGAPEHPVDSFWAERFLEYPDDPLSGPFRKADSVLRSAEPARDKTVEDDKTAKIITEGIQGHWYPFGGGSHICPGRHFAKYAVLAGLAITMKELEIELVNRDFARETRPDLREFPVGTLPPTRAVPVRVRQRRDSAL
ncbi:cytochrome P450 [Podospora didyma]|uniref:Cytochrome P450 n=1 Tax=Podospora didyma TaxID=330526 RepID=A0AAE0K0T2_9PEZI|nr:cytochrome P450 [Podospora didyma]